MAINNSVYINGMDVYDTFGLTVNSITPNSPLAPVRNERIAGSFIQSVLDMGKITLDCTIINASSNSDMNLKLEALGEAIGLHAGSPKIITIKINYFAAGAVVGSAIIEAIFNGEYDVPQLSDQAGRTLRKTCYVKIGFDVIGSKSPNGLVTKTLSAFTSQFRNWYFEEADALQGANQIKAILKYTAGVAPLSGLCSLAINGRFAHYPSYHVPITGSGADSYDLGPYGGVALYFAPGSSYTMKFPAPINFPAKEAHDFTIMVRFKATAYSDSASRVLWSDDLATNKHAIYFRNDTHTASVIINGVTTSVVAPAGFSTTGWNAIVVRYSTVSPYKKIWVYVPGQAVATNTAADGGDLLTFTNFFLGPAGASYRPTAYIGELAMWKYPLPDAAVTALLASSYPVRKTYEYDLCRRLTFLWDGSRGLNAESNEHGTIMLNHFLLSGGDMVIYDSERQSAYETFGLNNAIQYVISGDSDFGFPAWPVIERYNNFYLHLFSGAANKTVTLIYNPLRRA